MGREHHGDGYHPVCKDLELFVLIHRKLGLIVV